jgi:hypothetical protein
MGHRCCLHRRPVPRNGHCGPRGTVRQALAGAGS